MQNGAFGNPAETANDLSEVVTSSEHEKPRQLLSFSPHWTQSGVCANTGYLRGVLLLVGLKAWPDSTMLENAL